MYFHCRGVIKEGSYDRVSGGHPYTQEGWRPEPQSGFRPLVNLKQQLAEGGGKVAMTALHAPLSGGIAQEIKELIKILLT